MGRRALTIGVTGFADGLPDLDFSAKLVPRVSTVLAELGYDLTELVSRNVTSAQIGAKFGEVLASTGSDDVLVVHVLSHGEIGGDTVYVLGSDGTSDPTANIGHWMSTVQDCNGPLTLFLLDLCCAGTVARLPWQSRTPADRSRAWVIAACQGDEAAFDGRFSNAVTNVLHDIRERALDIGPAAEHVPLPAVAQAIRRDVNRLAAEADAYRQTVTASMLDISAEIVLPFFANPNHLADKHEQLRAELNPDFCRSWTISTKGSTHATSSTGRPGSAMWAATGDGSWTAVSAAGNMSSAPWRPGSTDSTTAPCPWSPAAPASASRRCSACSCAPRTPGCASRQSRYGTGSPRRRIARTRWSRCTSAGEAWPTSSGPSPASSASTNRPAHAH
jgi:hypothetical protein